MYRILFGAALALAALILDTNTSPAQQPLASKGWGSLSGKVTLAGDGAVPVPPNLLKKMMENPDKACCLAGKDDEKIDSLWLIDPKTRGIANVVIWVKPPADTYLPVHEKLKDKKELVIDQPHCAFIPRVSAYNPKVRDDKGKLVDSGRTLLIKNSAVVSHNIRVTGDGIVNEGFNKILPAKTELAVKLKPYKVALNLNCDLHTWMQGKIFVFDHPYYTITNEKGEYELPYVPAGAEISIMAYHEDPGYLLTNKGKAMTLKEGKNTFNFEIEKK